MTDTTNAPAPAAEITSVLTFEIPGIDGTQSFDCAEIPAPVRMDFLKAHTRAYIANRVNQTTVRHNKNEQVAAWARYDEAQKADALQTVVPKPEFERPAAPDLSAALAAALDALRKGDVRKQGTGEGKSRAKVDPLVKLVTDTVVREVFNAKHASDPKYTFPQAKKDVGTDGIKYLNAAIDARIASTPEAEQAALRAQLEKMRDERYIKPARLMLGLDTAKATKELPSIL